ncbi:MAG: tetratricopeptide repeat protein [Labilithrix sp.]|nr:tetratricopeptide repeat protein [Labilithrix sp.]MCW5810557.1 tetratricopeptide repeat protein [Labilithrix sp.]
MRRTVLGLVVSAVVLAGSTLSAQPKPSGPLAEGLAALNASEYAKAEAELAKVKGQPEAAFGLARAAFEQGKFDDADKHATASGTARAKVLRAEILLARGKQKEAVALLETLKNGKTVEARRAKLLLGETLIAMGKRGDADEPLKKVIEDYNDNTITQTDAEGLAQVGRAAFLLRSPKDANTAFKESEKADKKRVETLLWEAELFLDKYDPGHAAEVTKEALEIAPKRADALVMMARVKLDQTMDFDDAHKLVDEALAVNPRHAGAYAVKAGLSLRDMDIKSTDAAIAKGLASDPSDLELLSLKAASRFLDDDKSGYETARKDVFARNGEFARFYGIVGEYAEWEHRYDDIIVMMKEATKIDPDDGKAWAELGLTQMRSGDETGGLQAIQKAWSKDRFNVRVFNTLNMYEKQIPTEYDLVDDGVFKVRYHKEERPILERYVPRMLGEAWASMKSRYGFVPKVPVQVEMYANREQFSVRTSGLPNIGIQGVCFGGMIAAISPKAEPFNWGNVVWHELGHVFAIQLSKNHVPRWFTEGLSEYETIARRPEWARELDPELYQAITQNKLPGAVDMNRAFTHANDASDVTTAYYAASQMLIWTVERFGMKGVAKALELWGQGKKTPDVLQGAFGVSPADYDKGYRAWQLARLSRYKDQYIFARRPQDVDDAKRALKNTPNDASAHVDLALALLRARKADDAKKELDAALAIDPKNADAHFVSARLALGKKDAATAQKHLDTMRSQGHDGYVVHMLLADIAESKEDKTQMRFHLEAAHRLDPSQSEPLKGLYDLAHEAKNAGDELALLRELAQLEQHDKKVWRLLLEKLVAAKQWDEARRVGDSAVFVDVTGGPTHVLYARALAAQNAHGAAIYELETALLAKAKDKAEEATTHALLAASLAATGKKPEAIKHRDEALKLDPANEEAKALKL